MSFARRILSLIWSTKRLMLPTAFGSGVVIGAGGATIEVGGTAVTVGGSGALDGGGVVGSGVGAGGCAGCCGPLAPAASLRRFQRLDGFSPVPFIVDNYIVYRLINVLCQNLSENVPQINIQMLIGEYHVHERHRWIRGALFCVCGKTPFYVVK